jgi:hypothetical protein
VNSTPHWLVPVRYVQKDRILIIRKQEPFFRQFLNNLNINIASHIYIISKDLAICIVQSAAAIPDVVSDSMEKHENHDIAMLAFVSFSSIRSTE